jgi:hypothetical protein
VGRNNGTDGSRKVHDDNASYVGVPDQSEYRIEATAFPHRGQVRGSSGIDRAVVARLRKTGEAVVVWEPI